MPGDWQSVYRSRLTSPEEAVKSIESGHTVSMPLFPPRTIPAPLFARREELRGVHLRMNSPTQDPGWLKPGCEDAFRIEFETFIGDFARNVHDERRGHFLPNLFSTTFKPDDEARPGVRRPNVALVICSPPNEAGYVHFGAHHWTKRSLIRRSDISIAEVDPSLLKVHGDVYAHVSEIDHFVEYTPPAVTPEQLDLVIEQVAEEHRAEMRDLIPQIPAERLAPVLPLLTAIEPSALRRFLGLVPPPEYYKDIAGYLSEVLEDGDCIQVGVGEPSSLMPMLGAFDRKKDLGLHTELGSPGMAQLVEAGVINGSRKNQFKGKAIAAAWTGCNEADFAIINDNPTFELYDPEYILNVKTIAKNHRQVSINSAITVDLIGQINAESVFGGRMINGTGGQPETHISAFLSEGGKAITLLPSTALGGTVSRIVPQQDAGSIVTIPRYFADIVITEYGVARLLGKNHLERAEELIAVAHPDFRGELRSSMRTMFLP